MLEGNSGHIQSNEVFNLTNKKKVDKKTSKKSLSFHGDELLPAVNDLPAEALFTPKPKVTTQAVAKSCILITLIWNLKPTG